MIMIALASGLTMEKELVEIIKPSSPAQANSHRVKYY
jgi:hypothetical protein